MTEAEKAAALADEIDDELNELRGRFANRESDHFSFGLKFSSWDTIARALRLLAEQGAPPPAPADLRGAITAEIYSQFAGGTSDPTLDELGIAVAGDYADAAISAAGYVVVQTAINANRD